MKTGPIAVVCATLLVAGFAFWPTIYCYDRLGLGGGYSKPIRINRLTGRAEEYPWDYAVPPAAKPTTSPTGGSPFAAIRAENSDLPLPDAERVKITGNASFGYGLFRGLFRGKLYNGSSWTVERVTFRIVAKEVGGKVRWDRKFEERIRIRPLTTEEFAVGVTGEENAGSCEWSVEAAYGRKP